MDEIYEKLRKSGLTGNESKIYYELLKRGSLSANKVSRKIGMDRTLTYTVLNHLIEKGLVSYVIKNNKKYFEASDPENLLNPVEAKKIFIQDLMPQLKSIEKIKDVIQEINVYEGKEALRSYFKIFKKYKKLCSFGATGRAYDALYESPRLVKELEKIGFQARIITSLKYSNHPMTKVKNMQIKFLDLKSEATTSIFTDMIVIHILTQKPIIIVIKNKEIAESYQNYFEILWSVAKKR